MEMSFNRYNKFFSRKKNDTRQPRLYSNDARI